METALSQAPVDLQMLKREVAGIATYVAELRIAINSLRAPELAGERLPSIRNDLTAVRDSTRAAADKILDTAEGILMSSASGELKPADIEGKMMELMEACSFQDLNGQRLTRAFTMLNAIEERLGSFVAQARACDGAAPSGDLQMKIERRNSERLVYGPGHNAALGQGDIDMLMAG
jgi:chemotaxis protein CheZ